MEHASGTDPMGFLAKHLRIELAPFRPIRRGRFLAVIIRRDLSSAMGRLKVGMPLGRLQAILVRDVFRFAWPAQHIHNLLLTPEREYIYDDDLFLPPAWRHRARSAIEARCVRMDECVSTAMASYGNAHAFPTDFLRDHKLLAQLVEVHLEGKFRLISPMEFVILHAWNSDTGGLQIGATCGGQSIGHLACSGHSEGGFYGIGHPDTGKGEPDYPGFGRTFFAPGKFAGGKEGILLVFESEGIHAITHFPHAAYAGNAHGGVPSCRHDGQTARRD